MTTPFLSLKAARARTIRAIRATTDAASAVERAATSIALLDRGRWPAFVDREEAQERFYDRRATHEAHIQGNRAYLWLHAQGLVEHARTILTAATPMLDWRLTTNSPDALTFRGAVADMLCAGRPVRARGDDWDELDAAFVPNPSDTLDDLWDTPLAFHHRQDRLGDLIIDLEEGGMIHTICQELGLHANGPIPPDARHPAFRALCDWATWLRFGGGGCAQGQWIKGLSGTTLKKLIVTYGDQRSVAGMRAAMDAVNLLVEDIHAIGGNRRVCTYNDAGGSAVFSFDSHNAMPGDDPFTPWADVALRSILGMAMIGGSALVVERQGNLRIDGAPARETFIARLEDGDATWFDEDSCRAAFSYDGTTGLALPRETGRLYRGGPRT